MFANQIERIDVFGDRVIKNDAFRSITLAVYTFLDNAEFCI